MKKFHIKKFVLAVFIFIALLLAIDVVTDLISKKPLGKILETENIVFKVLAALVGAFFYAAYHKKEPTEEN